jgi:hypothetical protein
VAADHPDWQADWLYALVLRQADEAWGRCNRDPDRFGRRYVLIEEWPGGRYTSSRGEVVRAWVRDEGGLRVIALPEHERLTFEIDRYPLYPSILMEFHILPDRRRVELGFREAALSGRGRVYLVRGEGENATLESDPAGWFWKS